MSVINQMLRDLDARRAPQSASTVGAGTGTSVPALPARRHGNPRSRRLPVIALAGTVAIAAAAYGDWPGLLSGRANAATNAAAVPAPLAFDATAPASPLPDLAPPAAAREQPSEKNRAAVPAPARSETLALRTPPTLTPVANFLSTPVLSASAAVAAPTLPVAAPGPASIDKKMMLLTADQRAQAAYRTAVDATNAGHPQVAIDRALEALQQAPLHRAARQLAAVLLHAQSATPRAVALLSEGLAIDPEHAAAALLLARLQLEQGAPDVALAVLDRSALHSADAEGLRAGILAQQGDFKRSLVAYESALRQQPGNATWWLGLGVALESEGRAAQALQSYAKAQALGLDRDELTSFVEQRLRALN